MSLPCVVRILQLPCTRPHELISLSSLFITPACHDRIAYDNSHHLQARAIAMLALRRLYERTRVEDQGQRVNAV